MIYYIKSLRKCSLISDSSQKSEESYIGHSPFHPQETVQEVVEPEPARLNVWICPWVPSLPGEGRQMGCVSQPMGNELCRTGGKVFPSPAPETKRIALHEGSLYPLL